MSTRQVSELVPNTLSLRERTILEFYAEGLGEREVAIRLSVSRRTVSIIRSQIAKKLAVRISSAHPFQIGEVVLAH
jgi:DNA-binding NarL/FixJ family response regulator